MKTRFHSYTIQTLFMLVSFLVFAAVPALAADLPAGAKCVNGVLIKPHYGPPGKGANWLQSRTRCEAVDFAAMETGVGGAEGKKTRTSASRGVHGKPGYSWRLAGPSQ